MTPPSHDVGGAVEAYAAYLNAPRGVLDSEQQMLFDEDLARARAAMERAWLEAVHALAPVPEIGPAPTPWTAVPDAWRWPTVRRMIRRLGRRRG